MSWENPSKRAYPASRDTRQRLGERGEKVARRYLEGRGFTILGNNVRTPAGELDIIAMDGTTLAFIEVRTRRSQSFGRPEESITAAKRRHLREAAQWYLQEHGLDNVLWRIDLVTLERRPGQRVLSLEHIPNAIEE